MDMCNKCHRDISDSDCPSCKKKVLCSDCAMLGGVRSDFTCDDCENETNGLEVAMRSLYGESSSSSSSSSSIPRRRRDNVKISIEIPVLWIKIPADQLFKKSIDNMIKQYYKPENGFMEHLVSTQSVISGEFLLHSVFHNLPDAKLVVYTTKDSMVEWKNDKIEIIKVESIDSTIAKNPNSLMRNKYDGTNMYVIDKDTMDKKGTFETFDATEIKRFYEAGYSLKINVTPTIASILF